MDQRSTQTPGTRAALCADGAIEIAPVDWLDDDGCDAPAEVGLRDAPALAFCKSLNLRKKPLCLIARPGLPTNDGITGSRFIEVWVANGAVVSTFVERLG